MIMFAALAAAAPLGVKVTMPPATLSGQAATLTLTLPAATPAGHLWPLRLRVLVVASGQTLGNTTIAAYAGGANISVASDVITVPFVAPSSSGRERLRVTLLDEGRSAAAALWSSDGPVELWLIPPWLSIVAPVATVALALALRQVLVALALGVWLGATIVHGLNPLAGALRLVDSYLVASVGGGSHPLVIVFTILLGGTISVVRASGGAAGLARLAASRTSKPSHVLLATAASAPTADTGPALPPRAALSAH
jgi:hypothetical protein